MMFNKVKKFLIDIFHTYLTLSFVFLICWAIDFDSSSPLLKVSLIITLISGFYWYYKGCISKVPDDEEHYLLLGKQKK